MSSAPQSDCAPRTWRRSREGCSARSSAAKEAYDAHERVLELESRATRRRPDRRHVPLPGRGSIHAPALDGLRCRLRGRPRKGLELIQQAAEYRGDNQADARLALVLLYNREQRFDEALAQLEALRARYPLNRLLWLETGATLLRAGRHAEADGVLSEGISRARPPIRVSGCSAKRRCGTTSAAPPARLSGRTAEARADLSSALRAARAQLGARARPFRARQDRKERRQSGCRAQAPRIRRRARRQRSRRRNR